MRRRTNNVKTQTQTAFFLNRILRDSAERTRAFPSQNSTERERERGKKERGDRGDRGDREDRLTVSEYRAAASAPVPALRASRRLSVAAKLPPRLRKRKIREIREGEKGRGHESEKRMREDREGETGEPKIPSTERHSELVSFLVKRPSVLMIYAKSESEEKCVLKDDTAEEKAQVSTFVTLGTVGSDM